MENIKALFWIIILPYIMLCEAITDRSESAKDHTSGPGEGFLRIIAVASALVQLVVVAVGLIIWKSIATTT